MFDIIQRIIYHKSTILRLKRKCNSLLINEIVILVYSKELDFLNTFQDISEITRYIYSRVHHETFDSSNTSTLIKRFISSTVHDEIVNDSKLKELAALSHWISAYYISKTLNSKSKNNITKEHLEKAKSIYNTKALSDKAYSHYYSVITTNHKKSISHVSEIRKKIRDRLHFEIIKPLNISGQHLVTFVTVFTSIYFCLSYLYFTKYLGHFGINTSNYFYISDYFSVSLAPLSSIVVGVFISVIWVAYGATNRINTTIEEIDTGKQSTTWLDYSFYSIIILATLASALTYYNTGSIPTRMFYLNLFLLALLVITKIPIEKYFSNSISIRVFLFVIIVSLLYVYDKASVSIENVLKKNNSKTISVKYDGITLNGHELRHLATTTDYNFYWCYDHNKSIVIPKHKLISISISN